MKGVTESRLGARVRVAARAVLAVLVSLSATAAVNAGCEGSGFGGTGHTEPGSGFGGTGHACEGEVVGITGVITGFGSIFVAGEEIHYGDAFTLDTPTGAAGVGALGLGQHVAVQARMHDGRLEAQRIALAPQVVAPVQRAAGDVLQAAGQTVHLNASTQRVNWPGDELPAGQWLTVFGLRGPDGGIVATRVVARAPADAVYVEGVPEALGDGLAQVAGLTVRLPAGALLERTGAAQVFSGVLNAAGVLDAQTLRPAPVTQLLEALPPGARVIGENILPPLSGGAPLRLFGRDVALEPETLTPGGPLPANGYVRVTALLMDGLLHTLALDAAPASAWPGLINLPGALLAPALTPWSVLAPPIEYPMPPGLPGPVIPERSLQAPWWPGSGGWQPNGRLGR